MTRIKHILIGRNPSRTLARIAVIAVVALLFFGLLARPVRVTGISMEPTLTDGTIHFVNFLKYRLSEPERGDMVAISMPGRRAYYMKRILGLPGESIAFDEGRLIIDGIVVNEPYIQFQGNWRLTATTIPADEYFVAGDNRATDFTGHTLGFVARDRVEGVLLK